MTAVVGITAAVVVAAGIGVIIALNAVERRRLCAARRRYAERQAVIDDALPMHFEHVPTADQIGAEVERTLAKWAAEGGSGR